MTNLLDRVTKVALVGLRFWDEATSTFISEGLRVIAYHQAAPDRIYEAFANHSNTFILQGLPSLGTVEFENVLLTDWPPARRYPLFVEVNDLEGRFIPFRMVVKVPTGGFADLDCTTSGSPPNVLSVGKIPLFSAPSRIPPSGCGVSYMRLAQFKSDPVTGKPQSMPAAWAVLEIWQGAARLGRTLANVQGSAALIFSYPPFTPWSGLGSPPVAANGAAMPVQKWPIQLRVFYTPQSQLPQPATVFSDAAPDLCHALTEQAAAQLWREYPTAHLADQILEYGKELVIRSRDGTDHVTELSIVAIS